MSTKLPDASTDETGVSDRVADWLEEESSAATTDETAKQCGACGDPDGVHRLVLTVDWVDRLVEKYDAGAPDEECVVPLCTRCRSWAETLEIAELNLDRYGQAEREKLRRERDRFLESLQVRSISNFPVPEELAVVE